LTNHIVLYQPLIPANTGNIARTCAGTNTVLHLIKPLGFSTEDKQLKRAGLDYWNEVDIRYYENLVHFFESNPEGEFYYITKFGQKRYSEVDYSDLSKNYYFIFGQETKGLPKEIIENNQNTALRIPMDDTHIRSLNLSNTAAILVYEALRQQSFDSLH